MKGDQIACGINPALTLLLDDAKIIKKVWIQHEKNNEKIILAQSLCAQKNIPHGYKSNAFLTKLCNTAKHQGIVVIFCQKSDTLKFIENASKKLFCLYLDCIQDPQNFGAIIRSSAFFGVDRVFYPSRNSAPFNASAIKASAGAGITYPPQKISSPSSFFQRCLENNFIIVGTSSKNEGSSITEFANIVDTSKNLLIAIGNESCGISNVTKKFCSHTVTILPKNDKIESLNASVAAGIILFSLSNV